MLVRDTREIPCQIKYGSLTPGAIFEDNKQNGYFMITNHDGLDDGSYWAVNLRTGEMEEFDDYENVIQLSAELVIKNYQEI